jgi:putative transposase
MRVGIIQVPCVDSVSDVELLRRFKVLYPKPTKYQVASFAEIERLLRTGGDDASEVGASRGVGESTANDGRLY